MGIPRYQIAQQGTSRTVSYQAELPDTLPILRETVQCQGRQQDPPQQVYQSLPAPDPRNLPKRTPLRVTERKVYKKVGR